MLSLLLAVLPAVAQAPRFDPLPAPSASIAFVANAGQWPDAHRFRADAGALTLACERDGLRLFLHGEGGAACALQMSWDAAPGQPSPRGGATLPGARHFLHGSDPSAWRTAAAHAEVIYEGIRAGIGLRVRTAAGRIEYDLLLAPGADLESFTMRCEGADGLRLEADGALVLLTSAGPLRQTPPRTWQVAPDGAAIPRASAFVLLAPDRFGFRVEGADPALPTIVDPGLEWATFLGGSGHDLISSVAPAAQGDWIVTGWTRSPNFPATTGVFNPSGAMDGFVARFSADGSQLLWSAVIGGSGNEDFYSVAVDSADRAVVAGYTESADFPTTPVGGWGTARNGPSDGVVLRLKADGSGLDWSKYVGGSDDDFEEFAGVTIAPGDEPVIASSTHSFDYPSVGTAASAMSGGPEDAVVTRFAADGSAVLMSTCLSGPLIGLGEHDEGAAVRVMPGGTTVIVAGDTADPNFPVTAGTLGTTFSGEKDCFLAIVDLATGARLASTLIGGSGEDEVRAAGLEVDAAGNVYLVAATDSADYPMPAIGYDLAYDDRGDLAITIVDSALAGAGPGIPLAGTYLGTIRDEEFGSIALAPDGSVLVAGSTNHPGFPTTLGAWDSVHNGAVNFDDGFVARFDPALTTLRYSSFVGGSGIDLPLHLAVAGPDAVVLAGATTSVDFSIRPGAADPSFNGLSDGFLLRLDLRPCPILAVQPDPLRRGQAATFRVTELTSGERAYIAYSLTGVGFGSAPPPLGGLRLDLIGAVALLGQTPPANAAGVATLNLTVPPGAPLVTLWTQAAVARGIAGSHSVKSNVVARAVAP